MIHSRQWEKSVARIRGRCWKISLSGLYFIWESSTALEILRRLSNFLIILIDKIKFLNHYLAEFITDDKFMYLYNYSSI